MSRCIYCGNYPTTAEHVFGDWLRKHLPSKNIRLALTLSSKQKQEGIWSKLKGGVVGFKNATPHGWKVKCVCSKCNSGWMSQIQDAAQPFVAEMIKNKRLLLDQNAQNAIAAWAASAAITAEFDKRNAVATTDAQRREFFTTHSPPRTFKIWVGNFPAERAPTFYWHPITSLHFDQSVKASENPRLFANTPNTQTTTYMLGHLYVHVFSSEHKEVVDLINLDGRRGRNVMVQIWPITSPMIHWPPTPMSDRDARVIQETIIVNLSRMAHDDLPPI